MRLSMTCSFKTQEVGEANKKYWRFPLEVDLAPEGWISSPDNKSLVTNEHSISPLFSQNQSLPPPSLSVVYVCDRA